MEKYLNLLGNHSLLLLSEEGVIEFFSDEKGVKPLLDYYHQYGVSKKPLTLVDKVMGRGAILLAQLINVHTIYTPLVSEDALSLANEYKINISYQTLVPYIINNTKTGRCPIESSVIGISDTMIGYQTIMETLKKLSKRE